MLRDRINRTANHWFWTGVQMPSGHGRVTIRPYRGRYAHRVIYELLVGNLGSHLVHHICETPLCVRPDHLELKTINAHIRDHKIKETCKNGHPWTPENTEYVTRRTGRYKVGVKMRRCVACRRVAHRELMRKWRAEGRVK